MKFKFEHENQNFYDAVGASQEDFKATMEKTNSLVREFAENPDLKGNSHLMEMFYGLSKEELCIALFGCYQNLLNERKRQEFNPMSELLRSMMGGSQDEEDRDIDQILD